MEKMSRRLKIDAIKRIALGRSTPAQEFPITDSDKAWKVVYLKSDDSNTYLFYESDEDKKVLPADEVEKLSGQFNLMIFQIVTTANKHLFEDQFFVTRAGSLPPPKWLLKPQIPGVPDF